MQPGLFIIILVLKSERLVRVLVNPLILFQTTSGGVFAVPQEIAVDAVAVVVVAHQFLAVEGDGGEAGRRRRGRRFGRGRLKVGFQTTSMLTANEIVKEQIVQTTSKKIVRSSEQQKPRVCVPHTPYVGIGGFMRATLATAYLYFLLH